MTNQVKISELPSMKDLKGIVEPFAGLSQAQQSGNWSFLFCFMLPAGLPCITACASVIG